MGGGGEERDFPEFSSKTFLLRLMQSLQTVSRVCDVMVVVCVVVYVYMRGKYDVNDGGSQSTVRPFTLTTSTGSVCVVW